MKRKLAAVNKENCEEHPRSNGAQNIFVLRSQDGHITQVSEDTEGRVTKKVVQGDAKDQGTSEDVSQSDPRPGTSVSQSQTTRNSGTDDGYDKNFWILSAYNL